MLTKSLQLKRTYCRQAYYQYYYNRTCFSQDSDIEIIMETSNKIKLFHMFYVIQISDKKEVDTELYQILFVKYKESNQSIQL